MNNCYCGHPKERHGSATPGPIPRLDYSPCDHCCCKDYAESQEPKVCPEGYCYKHELKDCSECSQEPKALEEKPLCAHAAGICRGNCKPQEEPKKCPPFHHMHTKNGDWSCMNIYDAEREGITLYPCKKETKPKEEAEYKLDIAMSYLKLVLPMAKGYAAKNDVGSNQEYIEDAEKFIKSQE